MSVCVYESELGESKNNKVIIGPLSLGLTIYSNQNPISNRLQKDRNYSGWSNFLARLYIHNTSFQMYNRHFHAFEDTIFYN